MFWRIHFEHSDDHTFFDDRATGTLSSFIKWSDGRQTELVPPVDLTSIGNSYLGSDGDNTVFLYEDGMVSVDIDIKTVNGKIGIDQINLLVRKS